MKTIFESYSLLCKYGIVLLLLFFADRVYCQTYYEIDIASNIASTGGGWATLDGFQLVQSSSSEYPHTDNNLEPEDIDFRHWLKGERNQTHPAELIYLPQGYQSYVPAGHRVEVLYHTDYGTAYQSTKQIGFIEQAWGCVPFLGCDPPFVIPLDLQNLDATSNGIIEIIHTNLLTNEFAWGAYVPIVVEGFKSLDVPILDTLQLPKIPYLVLHDPPGDNSFSFFEEMQTVCRETSTSYTSSVGFGNSFSLKVGTSGSAGLGIDVDYENSVEYSSSLNVTESRISNTSSERCFEVSTGFTTSDIAGGIGEDADIFFGHDERWFCGIYEEVEIVGIDSAKVTSGLTYAVDDTPGQSTTFILTKQGIQNDINIQLGIANDTSNSVLVRTRAANQAKVWQDVLALNESNIENATEPFGGSYQFSGGGSGGNFLEKLTTSEVTSIGVNVAIASNSAITNVATVGANGFTGGSEVSFGINEGMTTTNSQVNSKLIGYSLQDDDATDFFDVSAYKDPMYGTPVFKLNAGASRTSCPYEGGFRIDQPELGSEDVWNCSQTPKTLQYMQTPNLNDPINLRLDVCNESDTEREYYLELPVNTNNANVIVNGETLGGINNVVSYTIPPNTCFNDANGDKPLLTITRNQNTNIDYLNLVFLLYPACGGDKQKQEGKEMTLDITFGYPNPNASPDCPKALELAFVDGVRDLSGNSFHGRSTPTTSLMQSPCGMGIVLGDNADDVVFLPGSSVDGLEDFTIAFDIKLDGLNNSNNIISLANSTMDNELIISYNDFYTSPGFLLIIGGSLYSFPNSVNTLADLAWHHVAVTRYRDQATLFLDGVELSTITVTSHKLKVDPKGFVIGQDQDYVGGGFQGWQSMHGIISSLNMFPYALEEIRIPDLLCSSCPSQGTTCDDGNPKTMDDIEDGNCNCLGTVLPNALVSMHFENDLLDVSGNAMHGSSPNPIYATANCGQSFSIGNDIEDVIFLPEALTDELGDFTISVNAKIDTLAEGNNLLSCANEVYNNELLIGFDQAQGIVLMIGNIPHIFPNSLSILSDLDWHHIVISRKGHEARLYLDGVLIGSPIAVSNKVLKVDPNGLVLGQDQDIVGGGFQTGQTWWGKVDLLRIYAYAFEDVNIHFLDCVNCPLTRMVDDNSIATDHYFAEQEILSSGTIQANENVLFQAGNTITLEANFEIKVGASFETVICECPLSDN